jgi:uncharacterized protein YydD (DUF2326 family)
MFLKNLTISHGSTILRDIEFRSGINLIVDETVDGDAISTGNSVGKTTVLVLIDFCLAGNPKNIYTDPETKKEENKVVKDFLIQKKVLITLTLVKSFDDDRGKVVIERNFLSKKEIVRRVNGDDLTEDEFEATLLKLLFPTHKNDKPTLRQIISHNIRYRDESLNNTLKTLHGFTSDVEYETLYLFLLGCDFKKGATKQELLTRIKQEETYKNRLERVQTKTAYEATLSLIEDNIVGLNKRKANLNLNEDFENNLNELNDLKYEITRLSGQIGHLQMKRSLILESREELNSDLATIDFQELRILYGQAVSTLDKVHKTFEELVQFHNKMLEEKVKFITKELPAIEAEIAKHQSNLSRLLQKEGQLSESLSKSDSFEELEKIISQLTDSFRQKGELETIIQQLNEVEGNISDLVEKTEEIDSELFSDEFEVVLKAQVNKFNKHFAAVSNTLYGEQYALKYDKVNQKGGQRLYKFSAFNTNFSSGKKQGEIACFDIAYTMFADEEKIPCLHFLLNDKKELMHDNQLVKISELVNKSNIQFVASILRDKLPSEINKPENIILSLSQNDKLLRIERNQK